MKTVWGENLDVKNVLREYPRPQLVRDSYVNLNGIWHCAVTDTEDRPESFDSEIIVPFSPEAELSGMNRIVKPDETLWYMRRMTLPRGFNKGRILIHFGAVDQTAELFVNGCSAGKHIGGYNAFSFDITDYLKSKDNEFIVKVRDVSDTSYFARGKQKINRGGIWYTPQSGIWQTVWLESVPEEYIEKLIIVPLFDESAVSITAVSAADAAVSLSLCGKKEKGRTNEPIVVKLDEFEAWTPETPRLYSFTVKCGKDEVESYFAMRKFGVGVDKKGVKRLFLNNKPYFHNGVLDQGYWSDGLYTAPSDEALIYDITAMKMLGFNMLRKHIKVEPMRWYYHCDRLGMLVWQDMPSGGGEYSQAAILPFAPYVKDNNYKLLARESEEGRRMYKLELTEMIAQLISVPSIAMWVPFNEGWGQFDSEKICAYIKTLDDTRTVDHASGWHDQRIGDIKSVHFYFRPYHFKGDKLGRAVVLSEFGGYALRIPGHCYNEQDFGYKKLKDKKDLKKAFVALFEKQIAPAKQKGLCASVYTQVSDVEDEVNGFLTYDRKDLKLSAEDVFDTVSLLND